MSCSATAKERFDYYLSKGNTSFQSFKFIEAKIDYQNALYVCRELCSESDESLDESTLEFKWIPIVVELHRKIGLSSLYLHKWAMNDPNNKRAHFEDSVKAFRISLQWSKLDKATHDENVQALTNIILNEATREDFSVTKFVLSESFMEDLTQNVQPSMSLSHKLTCQIWFQLGSRFAKKAESSLSSGNIGHFVSLIDKLKKSSEILNFQANKILDLNDRLLFCQKSEEILRKISDLNNRVQGIKMLKAAKTFVESAQQQKNVTKTEDLLYMALDKLKEAEILVSEKDEILHCWILVETGLVLLKLNNRSSAKTKFENAVTTASILDLVHFDWFKIATKNIEEISKFETEDFLTSQKIDRAIQIIRKQSEFGLASFVTYILSSHPPNHFRGFSVTQWQGPFIDISKKLLIKLIAFYHTDKIDLDSFGPLYYKVCEEILKTLNRHFNEMKNK